MSLISIPNSSKVCRIENQVKIKALHAYQYVRFQGKSENFLSAEVKGMEGLELELLDGGIVSVKSPKDHILIFSTNIAYLVPSTGSSTLRGKITDVTPSSPRKA